MAALNCKTRFLPGKTLLPATVMLVWLLLATGCNSKVYLLTGPTMGTSFHIKVVAGRRSDLLSLQKAIVQRLEQVEQSMSTFRQDSEISRFNRLPAGCIFHPSSDLRAVMAVARQVYHLSRGAWDGTVKPLVDLWGFSRTPPPTETPQAATIASALKNTGFDKIKFLEDGNLVKTSTGLHLDLASIAKGYGVDQVAAVIEGAGFNNYLVEIGGEVIAAGQKPDGNPWKVGINRPAFQAALDEVFYVVELSEKAMATSGNYRRFLPIGGKNYSHIIDPRTGYPCESGVISATVMADKCVTADALATALMVMQPDQGINLIETIAGTEAMVVIRKGDGGLKSYFSSGFPPSTGS